MATAAEGRPKDDQTGNESKFPHEERAEVEVIGTGIEVRELMWMDVDGCGWMWMDVDGCGWMWMDVDGCGWMYHEYRRVQQGFPVDVFDFCAPDNQERWITTAIVD
jgi:hypothetical protein